MVDVKRLAGIIWMDSSRKGNMVADENLSPEVIQNGFSITSQINHTMAILPANNNVLTDDARKLNVATDFRDTKLGIFDKEPLDLSDVYIIPSPQKIKTNVFSSVVRNMLHWSPLERFSTAAKIKSEPRNTMYVAYKADANDSKPQGKRVEMGIVYNDVVRPFKRRKTLTLAS